MSHRPFLGMALLSLTVMASATCRKKAPEPGPEASAVPAGDTTILWTADTGYIASRWNGPVVTSDGTVFITGHEAAVTPPEGYASAAGKLQCGLYAFDSDGALKAKVLGHHCGVSSPGPGLVATDWGVVYGNDAGHLYGLWPDGRNVYRNAKIAGHNARPVVSSDGRIFVGGDALRGLNLEGEAVSYTLSVRASGPAMAPDGTLYFYSDGGLYSAHPSGDGRLIASGRGWKEDRPVLDPQGYVYIVGSKSIVKMAVTGEAHWDLPLDSTLGASPVVGPDGTLFTATREGLISAFSPAGARKWSVPLDAWIQAEMSVDSYGSVWVSDAKGTVQRIDADGTVGWRYTLPCRTTGTPAPSPDGGTAYVGCGWKLFALRAS